MSTNYPSSIDNGVSLPYPTATSVLSNPNLANGQDNQNDAIIAVQKMVGANASLVTLQSSPTATGNVLQAVNASLSTWGQLTSANVATITGTGAFVFATSPTINSPVLTSPQISNATFTGSTGTFSAGTITSSGLITGNNGFMIAAGTVSLPTNSITAPYLATSAITLGYAQITANFTCATTGATQVTGLTASVSIPAGGRRVKITAWSSAMQQNNGLDSTTLSLWNGTVGSGTQIATSSQTGGGANYQTAALCIAVLSPAAGPQTYNVGFSTQAGTGTLQATSTSPAFILVEAI